MVLKFENDTVSFLGALVLIGATATLSAAEEKTSWLDAPWKFRAKGYGWLPEGSATLKIDQTEVANLPESLDNILDSRTGVGFTVLALRPGGSERSGDDLLAVACTGRGNGASIQAAARAELAPTGSVSHPLPLGGEGRVRGHERAARCVGLQKMQRLQPG